MIVNLDTWPEWSILNYEYAEAKRRMSKAYDVLKQLEWSGNYSYCTGWPCCPVCKGIKPGHGEDKRGIPPDNSGHRNDCKLMDVLKNDR